LLMASDNQFAIQADIVMEEEDPSWEKKRWEIVALTT
jgi:hypothetical protein